MLLSLLISLLSVFFLFIVWKSYVEVQTCLEYLFNKGWSLLPAALWLSTDT